MTVCWYLNRRGFRLRPSKWGEPVKRRVVILLSVLLLCLVCSGCAEEQLQDGQYTVEVELSGGTGRATVESPARVVIENGNVTATIVWSSPFYEYMMIGETRYDPIQEKGNATFQIPVVLDKDMSVRASTIAMSQPYLIDYTLCFDSATLEGAQK